LSKLAQSLEGLEVVYLLLWVEFQEHDVLVPATGHDVVLDLHNPTNLILVDLD